MKICEPSDQLIDQLVDGCLSGEQYRQALQALEANPSRWRYCAGVSAGAGGISGVETVGRQSGRLASPDSGPATVKARRR